MKEHNYENLHKANKPRERRGNIISNLISGFIIVLIGATLLPHVASAVKGGLHGPRI